MAASQQSKPALAMLALASPRMPQPERIVVAAAKRFGEDLPLAFGGQQDDTMHFEANGRMLSAALMPAPIPPDELARPIASSWWWPQASAQLAGHTHHVIVGHLGAESDGAGAVAARLLLTRLITLMIDETDAVGVYWGDGALVHDAPIFQRLTGGISPSNVPTALWVNIQVGPDMQAAEAGQTGLFAGYTLGLDALGHLELQTRQAAIDGEQMFQTIHDFAHYLISARPVIADGDTIGATEHERIVVRYRPNVWEPTKQAYELFFPNASAPTSRLN